MTNQKFKVSDVRLKEAKRMYWFLADTKTLFCGKKTERSANCMCFDADACKYLCLLSELKNVDDLVDSIIGFCQDAGLKEKQLEFDF